MDIYRKTAIVIGILFILGTVAGISSGVVTGPVLMDSDYLTKVASNESKIATGALLVLVMGFSLAMIPVVMLPIFKKENEILAAGAIIFRGVLETVTYMVIATSWLLLILVSQGYAVASTEDAAIIKALGILITQEVYWTEHILALVFAIGASMLYWLFYKTKLIPSWLSLWGLIGAILYILAPIANMFDSQHVALSLGVKWGNLMFPLAIQEMVFALWLILKGFNQNAIASLFEK